MPKSLVFQIITFITVAVSIATAQSSTSNVYSVIVMPIGNPGSIPQVELIDVPYISQGLTNWCGLATQCMVLRYYGKNVYLWEVAKAYSFSPKDGILGIPGDWGRVEDYIGDHGLEVEWFHWPTLPPLRPSSSEVRDWIRQRLLDRRPVVAFLSYPSRHAVVLTGWEQRDGTSYVYAHDPSGALTLKMPGNPGRNRPQVHVRLEWEAFFAEANQASAVPQKLMCLKQDTSGPDPKLPTLQLGHGASWVEAKEISGLYAKFLDWLNSTQGISGMLGVHIRTQDATRADLQMHKGLRWRLVMERGILISEDTRNPGPWPAQGTLLSVEGNRAGLDQVHLTNGSSTEKRVKLHLMLLKADDLDEAPVRKQERELTIPAGRAVPVGNLELEFDNLKSGSYVTAILVEVPDISQGSYNILMPPITIREESEEFEPGMLDCVMCIDKSGSMADDIEAVQKVLDEVLQELNTYTSEKNISLQLGLVTYTRHDDESNFGPQWLQAQPLTSDIEKIKKSIADIQILGIGAGGGGWEDMYAALLCGMGARDLLENVELRNKYGQPDGSKNLLDMGWRHGACKLCIPIGDEPPSDPDWKDRTLEIVVTRAVELDPVHMYPIVVQGPIESWLLGTKKAMSNLAERTGGQVTHVSKAEELPPALVKTVKLAVRRHRHEVWRKEHPPYALYIMALVIGLVVFFVFVGIFVAQFRRHPEQPLRHR